MPWRAPPLRSYSDAAKRSFYTRLQRYAVFAIIHGVVTVLALAGVLGPHGGGVLGPYGGLVFFAASIPLIWSWGAYQGDLATNGDLTERDRQRWRIALWVLPWSMAYYFQRYVRPREVF